MKRGVSFLLTLVFTLVWSNSGYAAAAQNADANSARISDLTADAFASTADYGYEEGEVIVQFRARTSLASLSREGKYLFDGRIRVEKVRRFDDLCVAKLTSDHYTTEELIQKAASIWYVDGVQPNSRMKISASSAKYQWYLSGSSDAVSTGSAGVGYDRMNVTYAADDVVVAVIDTGVDYTNPDLSGHMWVNPYSQLPGTYGYDFADGDDDPMDMYLGHGTHVAGVIAAENDDDYGIDGIADVKIMALKVVASDSEEGYLDDEALIEAFSYVFEAIKLGVNVAAVNCSFGGGNDEGDVLLNIFDELGARGTLTVFAAGNDGADVDASEYERSMVPFCVSSQYLLVVGATDESGAVSDFSNYGRNTVDLFVPGRDILSDFVEERFLPQFDTTENRLATSIYYNRFSGETDNENILPLNDNQLYTAVDIGVRSSYLIDTEVVSGGFYDDATGNCLHVQVVSDYVEHDNDYYEKENVLGFTEGSGVLWLDVTELNLDPEATYYISGLFGFREDGMDVIWQTVCLSSTAYEQRFVSFGGKTYFGVIGMYLPAGESFDYYLDSIAISKADISSEYLKKLEVMTGTSMACPIVTAAVAALRAANPTLDAVRLRKILVNNCTVKDAQLTGKCRTGATLDLGKLYSRATGVQLNATTKIIRYSKKKTVQLKATVKPGYVSNAKVTWKSSNTRYATVSSTGKVTLKKKGIGHVVTITATTTDKSNKKAKCRIRIKK